MINDLNLYLDACSTAPPLDLISNEVSRINDSLWGNPSSLHKYGLRASEIIERSRNEIANRYRIAPDQIIFTSGATESNYLSFKNGLEDCKPGRLVISSVEHPSVIYAAKSLEKKGWKIVLWPVDKYGIVKLEYIDELLSPPTKFVSLIWGQSEIGSIQPIDLISKECVKRKILFHTDATQVASQGLLPLDKFNFDFLSLSAHKFQGPIGIGMLIVGNRIFDMLSKKQKLDAQESSIRPGTQPASLISALSLAILNIKHKVIIDNKNTIFDNNPVSKITTEFRESLLRLEGISLIGHPTKRLPHHISILVANNRNNPIPSRVLVRLLSEKGIYVSSGTACSSSNLSDSPILEAIGIDKSFRQSVLRLSLGPWINFNELNLVPNILSDVIESVSKEMY